ncbi:MAG: hypothetical protein U0168_14190 [Nannocystaceae bacterium]
MGRQWVACWVLLAVSACGAPPDAREVEAPGHDRGACDATARPLTFVHQVRTKMFIDEVKPIPEACNVEAIIGPAPEPTAPAEAHEAWGARVAAYTAFCWSTNKTIFDQPADGGLRTPLDARIFANVGVAFTCEPGRDKPTWSRVSEIGRAGGTELAVFQGIANPIDIADDLTHSGRYAFVSSGKPSPKLELAFDLHRYRKNTEIWHRWAGSVACITDPAGNPGARARGGFTRTTAFPSHRAYLWATDKQGRDRELGVLQTIAQREFSNLWFLPSKPAVGSP